MSPASAGGPQARVAGREVGSGCPVYVVAELSANHGRDLDRAVEAVRAAREAGADAIKLQTYTPDTLTIDSDAPPFRIEKGSLWAGRTLYELYREAYMPWEWQPRLRDVAREVGVDLFSTPFDATAVRFLERLDVPAHKIASFELVDHELLREVGSTRKPAILSTGMASFEEIDEALRVLREAGASSVILLHCRSAYPAPPEEMNLATIPYLRDRFGVPVGLSDHTRGIAVPIAAVALGACVVEKHFTLSRALGGPDAAFSIEPAELREMVRGIREAERAIGTVKTGRTPEEARNAVFRRSIFVVSSLRRGETFDRSNLRVIRPGQGLPPRELPMVLGRRAARDIERGTPLTWDLVEGLIP